MMIKQTTPYIMMIRPASFDFNQQTAINNYYQKVLEGLTPAEVQVKALAEFDEMVKQLQLHDVEVIVIQDDSTHPKPDAIFPNNWVSFHADGRVGIYPMYAINRRLERRHDILQILQEEHQFGVTEVIDFTGYEKENKFLESTGSLVLDRVNKIAYAALSNRTNEVAVDDFCTQFNYEAVKFNAFQSIAQERLPIYHTNVMMSVADEFAVLCEGAIDDMAQRKAILSRLLDTGHNNITISENQNQRFAGNMLQVENKKGEKFQVMSTSAYAALTNDQIDYIRKYCKVVHSSLDTIEACGGGSARCMMAEVFLPKKTISASC